MPLDPAELATDSSPRNTPEFIDENPNRDLILEGMDLADEEQREAVEDEYGDDPTLLESDDVDDEIAPEISAIHHDHDADRN